MATGEAMFKYCGRLNSGPFTHDHVLIPGICEYVTWRGKRDSANEKLRSWDGKVMLLILSRFSRVRLHRRQPTRLTHPWDSPGKNTGVGCHFLLQCMKVKSESEVAQSCPTLGDPMDCSLPASSAHGILQARVLEWGATAFSSYRATMEGGFPLSWFVVLISILKIWNLKQFLCANSKNQNIHTSA